MIHFTLFTFFHFLPDFGNDNDYLGISFARCLIDSYSKSRSISNSIKILLSAGKYDFITKCFISLLYNQLGKYLFERFLINSRSSSFYKNWAIIISVFLTSLPFIDMPLILDHKYIYSISLIIFIGNIFDNMIAKKDLVRSSKQGRSKLGTNAKTRSVLS